MAFVVATVWVAGALAMFMRLMSRLRRERPVETFAARGGVTQSFMADGIPVSFDSEHLAPAVGGILPPRILLPMGIDRLLGQREFEAVLLHELAHARRRDNLIRLFYEISLCILWFHPLIWLAGARMALYRELSCDESVIRRAHGADLVAALAKLALPERTLFFEARASSHLSHRLVSLSGQLQPRRTASLLMASLFSAVMAASTLATVGHTACCFILRH
jgi:beta-lactamase regulating signal transducer with metallopeptidase domain